MKFKLTNAFTIAGISLLLLALLVPIESHSQSTLTKITYNGVNTSNAEGVLIALPKQNPQKIPVSIGYQIPPGTVVATPSGIQMEFTSVYGGNVITLNPNSKLRLTASAKGENYTNYNGKSGFNVKKKMNFFNVTDSRGKVILASKSTIYSMEVNKNIVRYNTEEGSISVIKKVPLQVGEAMTNSDRNKNRKLNAFKTEEQSDTMGESYLDVDQMESAYYPTVQEAINASLINIQMLEQTTNNPLALAEEKSYLAYLLLDYGRAGEAIAPLEEAIYLYAIVDEYDPYISEMILDLAEACYDSGDYEYGNKKLNLAVSLLQEDLQFAIEDYNYSIDFGDSEMLWIDGMYLADTYDNLSWAFHLRGDENASENYELDADEIRSRFN